MNDRRVSRFGATGVGVVALSLALASPSWAGTVASTAPSAATVNASGTTTIPGGSVTDSTSSATLQVTVSSDLGTLSMPTNTGLTAADGYTFSGPVISFVGTQANVNAGLASLTLTGTGTPGTANVSVTANEQVTGPGGNPVAYSPSNDHYYTFVPVANGGTPPTWTAAQAAANGSTELGQEGYLATIPNATILSFIGNHLNGAQNVWAGGYGNDYPSSNGPDGSQRSWTWGPAGSSSTPGVSGYAGPLAGQVFTECSNVTGNCGFENTTSFFQSSWNVSGMYQEPNNSGWTNGGASPDGEFVQEINYNPGTGATGKWNDLSPTATNGIQGYVIEYGDQATGASSYSGRTKSTSGVATANAPGAPTNVTTTSPADGQATVSWTPPTHTGGSPITGYTVTANGPGGPFTCTSTTTSCTVTGLQSGSYTFTVTAHNAIGATGASPTSALSVTAAATPTTPATPPATAPVAVCPSATRGLQSDRLGPFALLETQSNAQKANPHFRQTLNGYEHFCLASGGEIRLGYPTKAYLRQLTKQQQKRYRGRVVIALSSNARYHVAGVSVGASLSSARKLHLQRGFKIGANEWYVEIGAKHTYVLKVVGGTVRELGVAEHALASTRASAQRLIASFK